MALHVEQAEDGHRLGGGGGSDVAVVNRFLAHLAARGFSPATVRAYAFDTLNFLRFCDQRGLDLVRSRPATCSSIWTGRPTLTRRRRRRRWSGSTGAEEPRRRR